LARRSALLLLQQQHEVSVKREVEDKREVKRLERLEAEKRERVTVQAAVQRQANERVRKVLKENDRTLEVKRDKLTVKQQDQRVRMDAFGVEQEADRERKRRAVENKEEHRVLVVEKTKVAREVKNRELSGRKAVIEQRKEARAEGVEEQQSFKKELQRLNRCRKEANMLRIQRQEEYRRQQLVMKVNEDAQRQTERELEQERLMRRWQKAQIEMAKKREEVMGFFETVKKEKDWSKLSKLDMSKSLPGLDAPSPRQKQLKHSQTSKLR
jgi:hypothetical protein